jgi:ATP-dependent DNA helicase DinG
MQPEPGKAVPPPLRLSPSASSAIRAEIQKAGGREVTFLLEVGEDRTLRDPKTVARGNRSAVLAVSRDAPEGSVMVHNHPSGELEPSDADLAVAAALHEAGLGTAIVDNDATRIYVVVEPPAARKVEPLDLADLESFLSPGGPLSTTHPGFEDRPGQRDMARLVARRYNEGGVGLVEAGTGTGKSLAYLLPAALWALKNGERTVVSTNTINLQEQLVEKDLPLLEEALGCELRWALVKGRGNYVSIRRAHLAAAASASLFEEDRSGEINALVEWVGSTQDGSLSDLAAPPSEEVWEEVRSDPDICLKTRCPHFQQCFYQRARRGAAAAEILVVNHHLLFTDLAIRRVTNNFTQAAVLPPYRHLILDEAHNAEEAATDHLGVEVTRGGLFRLLSRLDRRGKGILADIREQLAAHPDRGSATELLGRIKDRILPAMEEARARLEPLLGFLGRTCQEEGSGVVRLGGDDEVDPRSAVEFVEALDGFLFSFDRLAGELRGLRERIQGDGSWSEVLEGRTLDLFSAQARLEASGQGVRRVLDPGVEGDSLVRWLELRGRGPEKTRNLALAAAPIEVGPSLREDLFERLDTSILTSATLTTRTGFEYLRARLGLGPGVMEGSTLSVEEAVVPSPFDFCLQTILAVPTDLAGPQEAGDRFQEETARIVTETALITGGGLFVLFTSHSALRRVAELLRGGEDVPPGPLFVQGEAPRARLLNQFVESGRGILLGTASFWEGVDVPGEPLRGLIIQKLPFQVPTEPIVQARMEAVLAQGGDPFWRYTLPDAALRLKQGFGRLIRTQDDRGAVLVLDDRILTRRYGPYLRQSLPPAPLSKGLWRDLRRVLEEFYA